MSHAVVIRVRLPEQVTHDDELQMLKEHVLPQARSQEGFQSGTWLNDHGDGMGVVVFDTEVHAHAALPTLRPPDGSAVRMLSSSVYEVGAQAGR